MEDNKINEDFSSFISTLNNDNSSNPVEVIENNDQVIPIIDNSIIEENNNFKAEDIVIDDKYIIKDETQPNNPNINPNLESVYDLTLDFIRKNNILHGIPSDLTEVNEEVINNLIEQDSIIRNTQALEYVKSKAGDEFVAELFDIVYNGGTIDDVKYVKENIIDNQKRLLSYDLENKSHRRMLIELFLKEGLDENIPGQKLRLSKIKEDTDKIFEDLADVTIATEAQQYFYDKFESLKHKEKERLSNIEKERQKQIYYEIEREKQWTNGFVTDLESSQLESSKKDDIRNQFSEIELSDGTKLPLWKYKMDNIWNNPKLTIKLMDFLTSFDEQKLEFKNKSLSPKDEFKSKLDQLISQKGKNKPISNSIVENQTNNKKTGIF